MNHRQRVHSSDSAFTSAASGRSSSLSSDADREEGGAGPASFGFSVEDAVMRRFLLEHHADPELVAALPPMIPSALSKEGEVDEFLLPTTGYREVIPMLVAYHVSLQQKIALIAYLLLLLFTVVVFFVLLVFLARANVQHATIFQSTVSAGSLAVTAPVTTIPKFSVKDRVVLQGGSVDVLGDVEVDLAHVHEETVLKNPLNLASQSRISTRSVLLGPTRFVGPVQLEGTFVESSLRASDSLVAFRPATFINVTSLSVVMAGASISFSSGMSVRCLNVSSLFLDRGNVLISGNVIMHSATINANVVTTGAISATSVDVSAASGVFILGKSFSCRSLSLRSGAAIWQYSAVRVSVASLRVSASTITVTGALSVAGMVQSEEVAVESNVTVAETLTSQSVVVSGAFVTTGLVTSGSLVVKETLNAQSTLWSSASLSVGKNFSCAVDFAVGQDLMVGDDVSFMDDVVILGSLTVGNNATIKGYSKVYALDRVYLNEQYFLGLLSTGSSQGDKLVVKEKGDLGGASVSGSLVVSETSTLMSPSAVLGIMSLQGSLLSVVNSSSSSLLSGNLTVAGYASFRNQWTVRDLQVLGQVFMSETLTVAGLADVASNATFAGLRVQSPSLSSFSSLYMSGNLVATRNLSVSSMFTMSDSDLGTITILGAMYVGTETTLRGGISGTNVTFQRDVTVSGNVNIGSKLVVEKQSSVGSLDVRKVLSSSGLLVGSLEASVGSASFINVAASDITVLGALTMVDMIAFSATLSNATVLSTMVINGSLVPMSDARISFTSISVGSDLFSQSVVVQGLALSCNGIVSASSLTVWKNLTVASTVSLQGPITFVLADFAAQQRAFMEGNVVVVGPLSVSSNLLPEQLLIGRNLTVGRDLICRGLSAVQAAMVSVSVSSLVVAGPVLMNSTVTSNGTIEALSSLSVSSSAFVDTVLVGASLLVSANANMKSGLYVNGSYTTLQSNLSVTGVVSVRSTAQLQQGFRAYAGTFKGDLVTQADPTVLSRSCNVSASGIHVHLTEMCMAISTNFGGFLYFSQDALGRATNFHFMQNGLQFAPSGFVGVNVSIPQSLFHSNMPVIIGNSSSPQVVFFTNPSASETLVLKANTSLIDNGSSCVSYRQGKLGVGVLTAMRSLHVGGNCKVRDAAKLRDVGLVMHSNSLLNGFELHHVRDFFNVSSQTQNRGDLVLVRKVDRRVGYSSPSGGFVFSNVGANGVERIAMAIHGDGRISLNLDPSLGPLQYPTHHVDINGTTRVRSRCEIHDYVESDFHPLESRVVWNHNQSTSGGRFEFVMDAPSDAVRFDKLTGYTMFTSTPGATLVHGSTDFLLNKTFCPLAIRASDGRISTSGNLNPIADLDARSLRVRDSLTVGNYSSFLGRSSFPTLFYHSANVSGGAPIGDGFRAAYYPTSPFWSIGGSLLLFERSFTSSDAITAFALTGSDGNAEPALVIRGGATNSVGIGTATPASALHVANGDIRSTVRVTAGNQFTLSGTLSSTSGFAAKVFVQNPVADGTRTVMFSAGSCSFANGAFVAGSDTGFAFAGSANIELSGATVGANQLRVYFTTPFYRAPVCTMKIGGARLFAEIFPRYNLFDVFLYKLDGSVQNWSSSGTIRLQIKCVGAI